jgi:glucokinase
MAQYTVGVDVGGTKTAYGLFGPDQSLVARTEMPTRLCGTPEQIADAVLDGIRAIVARHGLALADLEGVGLAFPSYIDYEAGRILCTTNITDLCGFDARDYFQAKLGVRVALDNDCHVAAMAEHRLGAGRGYHHLLFCAVSTGISSAMIINDRLFRGSYGAAGETGHMLITPEVGVQCGCGHAGCFMSHISGSMIVQHIRGWLDAGQSSVMLAMAKGDPAAIDCEIVRAAALAGDALAQSALEHMAYYLGVWTYNLYQALNINCYVFGGGLTGLGELLFGPARAHFDRLNVTQPGQEVHWKFAQLGRDAGIIGAQLLLHE